MFDNLLTEILLLLILGVLIIINTTLGSLMAKRKKEFNWDKFLDGISKALIIAVCMVLFLLCISLVPIVLERIGIYINDNIVTITEVFTMLLTAYKKYSLDCFDKIKRIMGVE